MSISPPHREVQLNAYLKTHYGDQRACMDKLKIQRDAINAAVDNVQDTLLALVGFYDKYKDMITETLSKHKQLLDSFDSDLERLSRIELLCALSAVMRAGDAQEPPRTLLDTVDSERLKAFRTVSSDNYHKMVARMQRLDTQFSTIAQQIQSLRPEIMLDTLLSINEELSAQENRVNMLRETYKRLNALSPSDRIPDDLRSLCRSLALSSHTETPRRLSALHESLQQTHNAYINSSEAVNATLRAVATLQSDLQFKLAEEVDRVRKIALSPHNENVRALEVVHSLPAHYLALCVELWRRQEAHLATLAEVERVRERLHLWREDETNDRLRFMETHGVWLSPLFFDALPALREKPLPLDVVCANSIESSALSVTSALCAHTLLSTPLERDELCAHIEIVSEIAGLSDCECDTMLAAIVSVRRREMATETERETEREAEAAKEEQPEEEDENDIEHVSENGSDRESEIESESEPLSVPVERTDIATETDPEKEKDTVKEIAQNELIARLERESEELRERLAELESKLAAQQQLLTSNKDVTTGTPFHTHAGAYQLEKETQGCGAEASETSETIPVRDVAHWLACVEAALKAGGDAQSVAFESDPALYQNEISFPDDVHGQSAAEQKKMKTTVGEKVMNFTLEVLSLHTRHLARTRYPLISFLNFEPGNIALFSPNFACSNRWAAFNITCPFRFLAKESLDTFLAKRTMPIPFFLGKITKIEEYIVNDPETAKEYNLREGTVYYIVYARAVLVDKLKPSSRSLAESSSDK